jgi:hypothetical protein
MIIRSVYETFFHKISTNERNIVVHGSAGIGKSAPFRDCRSLIQPFTLREDVFSTIRPRQATSCAPAGHLSD